MRLGEDRRARRRRPPRVHIFAPIHRQRQPLVPPRRTTLTKPTPSRALSSVSRDATDEDIKRAYRTLAQVAHPDKHASPALREVRPGATPAAVLRWACPLPSDPRIDSPARVVPASPPLPPPSAQAASRSFNKLNEAYEVLGDKDRRRIYDVYGMAGLDAGLEVGRKHKSLAEITEEFERRESQGGAQASRGQTQFPRRVRL